MNTYSDFIKITAQACKSKKTGCVVFNSDSGDFGRIFIKVGKIVGLEYGGEKGIDCLSSMAGIAKIDSHEFKEMPVIFGGSEMPETTVLLSTLVQRKQVTIAHQENELVEPNKPVVQEPVVNSVPVPPQPQPAAKPSDLSASQKSLMRDNLMEIIGPMADFLVKEHVDVAGSIEEAMLGLEQDIDADSLAKLRAALSKET